jgi:hypothetical protein
MNGFFLTIDILGFQKIVVNSTESELTNRIQEWTDLVKETLKNWNIHQFQLISDTLFVSTESSKEGLNQVINFSRELLSQGIQKSFPLRGAITHGSFVWGELTYGQAVIKSHKLESQQNWLGVTCDNSLPFITDCYDLNTVICYPPPLKSGVIQLYPVVVWEIPDFQILTRLLTSGGLTKKGECLDWSFANKLTNTIELANYLRIVTQLQANPSKFHGMLPAEIIELKLKDTQFLKT